MTRPPNRLPVLHLARFVLEAATALSVGTGSPDHVFDVTLVRDANGLPALPGSSLAGVLRSLWRENHDEGSTDDLFGYQKRRSGQRSRLMVSWGALLDSHGRPAEGLLLGEERARLDDPLYAAVLQQADEPVHRNRVRLTHKGTAADEGKFDRSVVPSGHRFAVELRFWSERTDDPDWEGLLALLGHPGLRLGGATRAGLGRLRCVRLHTRSFDLRREEDIEAFCTLGRGLADTAGLKDRDVPPLRLGGWYEGTLHLRARYFWRIGQGSVSLGPEGGERKPADLLPVVEERIDWGSGTGTRTAKMILLPASSLKGALAHRMAFHARRFAGAWASDDRLPDRPDAMPAEVTALLGEIKDSGKTEESASESRAGALFLDDAAIPTDTVKIARLVHNVIDRFTGGVRDHLLFEEESLLGGHLELRLALDARRLGTADVGAVARAFRAALDDLCEGRLALGSRTTSGNGFFTGRLEGPLAAWLQNPTPATARDEETSDAA